MPLIQKITEEEWALLQILRNPIWFGEFIRNYDQEEHWEYTDYQREFIADFNPFVSITCGRAVGKTVALVDKLLWYAINAFWNEAIVYTVPNKAQLDPVFLRIVRRLRTHPFLKHYCGRGINAQTFTIKLKNGTVIDCRIAGTSGTGANVVGLHVPIIILDEAGLYPFGTFIELIPALNRWQEGYQMIVSGVPTGVREKNVLYLTDQRDPKYTKHRVSAYRNPRYTEEDKARDIKQFGGEDSEDFVHLILGQHGVPTYTLFERSKMLIQDYKVFKGTLYGEKIKGDPTTLVRFYSALPPLPKNVESVLFGIDLGFTEPTVILVMYKVKGAPFWKFLVRATIYQMEYPAQENVIDHLDSMYSPNLIAIDEGNVGKAVVQHLKTDPTFKHKNYKEKILPINFASLLTIGMDEDGGDVRVKAKQFGMQLLQLKVNNHEICFSHADGAVISELERTIYKRGASGDLIFHTITVRGGTRHGEDHNTAALLCAVLGLYITNEMSQYSWQKRVRLYRPRWFRK